MIIADGRDVLRHDFHSHSLQSACGIHTWHELFECGAVRALVEDEMNLVLQEVFPLNFGAWEQVCNRFPRICSRVEGS